MTVNKTNQKEAVKKIDPKYERGVDLLKKFGLTENEALVYTYLLGRGSELGVSSIATGIGIHRQYVYLCMEKLIELGLVEVVAYGKLKKFKALAPIQLEKIAKRKVFEADDVVRELNTFSAIDNEQNFEVYSGDKQVKDYESLFFSQLEDNETQYVISGASQNFLEYFKDDYEPLALQGKRKKLKTYYIGGEHEKESLANAKKMNPNFNYRILEEMPNGVTSTVVRNESLVLYSLAKPPLIYVIKSGVIYTEYKAYFDMLWKMAK